MGAVQRGSKKANDSFKLMNPDSTPGSPWKAGHPDPGEATSASSSSLLSRLSYSSRVPFHVYCPQTALVSLHFPWPGDGVLGQGSVWHWPYVGTGGC